MPLYGWGHCLDHSSIVSLSNYNTGGRKLSCVGLWKIENVLDFTHGVTGFGDETNSCCVLRSKTGSTKLQNMWAEMFGPSAEELVGAFYHNNLGS